MDDHRYISGQSQGQTADLVKVKLLGSYLTWYSGCHKRVDNHY